MKILKPILTLTLIITMLTSFAGCLNEASQSEISTIVENDDTISAVIETTDETPTPTKKPTPTPTQKPTQKPTLKPTEKPVHKANESQSEPLVWIPTKGGKKYHSRSTCSNMSSPDQVTKSQAINMGFTACKKCYK